MKLFYIFSFSTFPLFNSCSWLRAVPRAHTGALLAKIPCSGDLQQILLPDFGTQVFGEGSAREPVQQGLWSSHSSPKNAKIMQPSRV